MKFLSAIFTVFMTSEFFTYDRSKVIRALRFHFISRREIKVLIILVNVFAIFSAVMYFMHVVSPVAFLLASGLWFILMISFWFVLPYIIYKRSKTFQNRFRVLFESNEMAIETERGHKGWNWDAFSAFTESPFYFYLYFDARTFFLVPKEAFADVHAARLFLKEKIG